MSTDWLPTRAVKWEEVEALPVEQKVMATGTIRLKDGDYYTYVFQTPVGGIKLEEFGRNQCADNPIKKTLIGLLKTNFVSYIGELNEDGAYPDEQYPTYEELRRREYP